MTPLVWALSIADDGVMLLKLEVKITFSLEYLGQPNY